MYDTGGIYRLDDERGKGKIYEIINKSKPKRVEKLISDSTFADAPTGTYYFYFDGYKLEATWSLGAIYVLLYFVHRCITHRLNLLMTLDYEGIYSYVASLPVGDDDIRLVFLDRIELECRDWEKRYGDPELEKTVAAKDIIISRYEFIKQFNDEIKKVYDDNKYYLSEEYKNECKKKGETICQEYVLEVFADYIKIFDKYIENPEQFLKDSFFNRDNWYAPIYATVSDLKKQFDEWKKFGVCIGSKIEKIMVKKNGKYGLINKNNEVVVDFIYDEIDCWNTRRCNIYPAMLNDKYGLIDRYGNIVEPFIYEDAQVVSDLDDNFGEYIYLLKEEDGKAIYSVADEKFLTDFIYDNIDYVSENRFLVYKDGKAGFIDIYGNEVTPLIFDQYTRDDFNNGYASVCQNGKFGMINYDGDLVIPCMYYLLDSYKGGLIRAIDDNNDTGFIDIKNNIVIPFGKFYTHSNFECGLVAVHSKEYGNVYIDKNGDILELKV